MSAISIVSASLASRTTHGSSARPDLHRGAIAALARDDLEALAGRTDEDRLQHALLTDRSDELGQVANGLARLVRVRIDVLDRNEPADGCATGPAELVDVVRVVAHAKGFGQSETAGARHVR